MIPDTEEEPPEIYVEPEELTGEKLERALQSEFLGFLRKGDPGGYHVEATWWPKKATTGVWPRIKISVHVNTHRQIYEELLNIREVVADFERAADL